MLELNKIICGDVLEELKKFPDKSLDLVLTDPPYKIQFTGKGSLAKKLRYEDYKKTMIDSLQSLHGHPTPKPLWMMAKLIKVSSKEGDLVCDPYCGSGTTLIAAKQLKRNYIGIDISKKYCNLAQSRLRQELLF